MYGVRLYRQQAGMSMQRLAKVSGVSLQTIYKTENDITSPSVSTLQRLASALGVTVVDILYADEVIARQHAVEQKVEHALTG
jgi:transcriptional regulator with XRE-family HTH domain